MFLFYIILCMHAAGPIVDSTMTLSILSSRDADPDIMFRLSFNVSFGLPSRIQCAGVVPKVIDDDNDGIVSGVDYEVIRSQYISSSQPDKTRLSFNQIRPRMGMEYRCTVTIIGRHNIASTDDILGSGSSSITVTGE